MSAQVATIGGTALSPFSSEGNNYDYVSLFQMETGVQSGGIGASTTSHPVLLNSHYVFFRATGGSVEQQVATNASTSGGRVADTAHTSTSTEVEWDPARPWFTNVNYYGGFRKKNTTTVYWYREAGDSGANITAGNDTYGEGTILSVYDGTNIYQHFGWWTVPNAPTSATVSSYNGTSVTLSWVKPTDLGGPTSLTGYRILYKKSTDSVYSSTGQVGSNSTLSYTISGLEASTTYNFLIAATNDVSDAHNADYSDPAAHTGTNSSTVTQKTAGGVWSGTTWVDPTIRVKVNASPVAITSSSWVAYTASSVVPSGHGLAAGDMVIISGTSNANLNGTWTVSGTTDTSISYTINAFSPSTTSGITGGTYDGWALGGMSVYDGSAWEAQ
jgi:hypothetical protein